MSYGSEVIHKDLPDLQCQSWRKSLQWQELFSCSCMTHEREQAKIVMVQDLKKNKKTKQNWWITHESLEVCDYAGIAAGNLDFFWG